MKGSAGIIAAPRVGTSIGGSIERGSGSFSSAFSSRGFSEFNKSPINGSKSPMMPKSPMVDINHGRGATSPFARVPSLVPERRMKISVLQESTAPKPPVFKDINIPKVEKSPWDTAKIITPTHYAEVKPVQASINRLDTGSPITRGDIKHIKNPNVANSGDPFKDTVVLWQNPNTKRSEKVEAPPVQKIDTPVDKSKVTAIEESQRAAIYSITPEKNEDQKVNPVKPPNLEKDRVSKAKPAVLFAEEFLEVVAVNPETSVQVREVVGADISQALEIVPKIMEARGVSRAQARAEAANILVKKYESNPDVSVVVKVLTEAQVKPRVKIVTNEQVTPQIRVVAQEQTQPNAQVLTQTDINIATSVKSESKSKLEPVVKKPKSKKVVLYFERDVLANKKRVKAAFNAARRIFETKKEDQKIYGKEVAEETIQDIKNDETKSEIVQGVQGDGTLEDFVNEVGGLGEIKDSKQLRKWANYIADKFTAVRLTFSKKLGFGAKGENAERVYKQALNGVVAYVAEEGSTGRLYARPGSTSVTYVNYSEGGEVTPRPYNQEDQKDQIPQQSAA